MPSRDGDKIPMDVWCPLIPPANYQQVRKYLGDLHRINAAYDDWRASMRGKPFVGIKVGVVLDRIRMLMIKVGISCGQNRTLAETVQSIVSEALRSKSYSMIEAMPDGSKENEIIKSTVQTFFERLKFTRDIYPIEEIEKAMPSDIKTEQESLGILGRFRKSDETEEILDRDKLAKRALQESNNILKRLLMYLLSPDPWGIN
ncbi:MAG: hypothetical protein BAJATHORv1_20278 [Candidatus Thorarchaeota archaeon]|nr:MAG: hypothetical protein BAJATHORv1_20278 [Candidatus Thorarchaeota archaeon]